MKNLLFSILISIGALSTLPLAAQTRTEVIHPAWTKNATIYEANIRQHSKEGSFQKFEEYLPELKKMGVKVIWLMPINPIGEKNRKGTLGSYYAVRDYRGVNPEFGTPADFKKLVKSIHAQGMYVIIDWVPNHTAWDHPWAEKHPEFYEKDKDGKFVPPVADWADVISLDYNNQQLRKEMVEAMRFWLTEYNIDGFRCDVAAMVPTDFWNDTRKELDKTKKVFMLAEAHEFELQEKAFDMTYGWQFKDLFNDIAKGKKSVKDLDAYLNGEEKHYHPDAYRMLHITNHDLNSWEGTEFVRLGDGVEAFLVLSNIMKGMPLMYSGQEAGNNKALNFFERDPIEWKPHPFKQLYTKLFQLKKTNKALWNGVAGGEMQRIHTGADEHVFAFTREKSGNKIVAIFNLSNKAQTAEIQSALAKGKLRDINSGAKAPRGTNLKFELKAWEYKVFAQ
ncbi:alpha-amylase family glycosyl hydrolase [Undibacterium sp.]|uniref:alpha-amylase family glycosyl hydrolase n=1 Tax=Undibacterium sp. TaxID=1914977 RepID=UPI0037539208